MKVGMGEVGMGEVGKSEKVKELNTSLSAAS